MVVRLFLFLLFFLGSIASTTQITRVNGRVYDPLTKEPIPFASILFVGTTDGKNADLDGNFSIETRSGGYWESALSADDDADEAVAAERRHAASAAKRQPGSAMLFGALHDVDDPPNKKYQYVDQATRLFNAQFHDSHDPYSELVLKALVKIGVAYKSAERHYIIETACKKCEERMKGRQDDGLPPPFGLARRLNGVSRRLKAYLTGRQGHQEVYTSRWGKAIANKT